MWHRSASKIFSRVMFVTGLALLILGPAAKSEEAPRATENAPAAGDAVSRAAPVAERELEIGRYYMSRGDYLGGINRFRSW
jgi:hypothetical protein